jgi:hypothetical protein
MINFKMMSHIGIYRPHLNFLVELCLYVMHLLIIHILSSIV